MFIDEAHDASKRDRLQVHVANCYAAEVKAQFIEKHRDDLDAGALVYVTLLPEGQEAKDPLTYDPEAAAAIYAEHMRQLGQSDD